MVTLTTRRGSEHPFAKLDEEKVRFILESKEPNVVLAAQFEVSPARISRIRRGLEWRHVEREK